MQPNRLVGHCMACGNTNGLTKHHLIPYNYYMASDPLRPKHFKKIILCKECHTMAHRILSNEEMATKYNKPEMVIDLINEFKELKEIVYKKYFQ